MLFRNLGVAQAMVQSGMFVAANAFQVEVCDDLFTHVRREEEAAMSRGELDEELARLSAMADCVRLRRWLLCNDSFAATSQWEGSEIARQVVSALREWRVRVRRHRMPEIVRSEPYAGLMHLAVAHGAKVHLAGIVNDDLSVDMEGQTRDVLRQLDEFAWGMWRSEASRRGGRRTPGTRRYGGTRAGTDAVWVATTGCHLALQQVAAWVGALLARR